MISRSQHAQTKGKLGFQRLGGQPKQSRHCFPQNTLTHTEPSVSPLPIAPITAPDYTPPATLSPSTQHPVPPFPSTNCHKMRGGGRATFFTSNHQKTREPTDLFVYHTEQSSQSPSSFIYKKVFPMLICFCILLLFYRL
jgi:hypothetical protein